MSDSRPVLFVTNHAPPFRVGAFAALHDREEAVFALIGGGVRHGGGAGTATEDLPFPALRCRQKAIGRLAASGRFRAVVAGLSGRLAPAVAWAGARSAGVPFLLWATMWAHPRTPAHLLSYLPVRHLYRHADAVVTYGPHVSRYVRSKGARGPVLEAPQSVDGGFWAAPVDGIRHAGFQVAFAGRLEAEKGAAVLAEAWRDVRPSLGDAALVAVGDGPMGPSLAAAGAMVLGRRPPADIRAIYAGSDVVVVPSVATRAFREPWGLTVNEAFHRGVPVVASDAVGAVAGGLVRHARTGLVVPAGNPGALAAALARLHGDPEGRRRLGAAARQAVSAHSHDAWSDGVSRALAAVGASRTVVA